MKAALLRDLPVWNLLYRFLPAAWGRGLAQEAARASLAVAAQVDDARPVVARIRAANATSARVAAAVDLVRRRDLDLAGHRAIGVVDDPRGEHGDLLVPTVMGRRDDALLRLEETTPTHPLHHEAPPLEPGCETRPTGMSRDRRSTPAARARRLPP